MSTGRSNEQGYQVEARNAAFSHLRPITLADGILGPDWRQIEFTQGFNPAGIPQSPFGHLQEHGLLTYEAAVALAWTLIAQHDWHQVEARLVRYNLETTYKCEKEGIVDMPVISSKMARDVNVTTPAKAPQP